MYVYGETEDNAEVFGDEIVLFCHSAHCFSVPFTLPVTQAVTVMMMLNDGCCWELE